MAFEEFRLPVYPMAEAIATRHVTDIMIRELRALQRNVGPGTFVCPYCFRDTPHSADSHNADRDNLEKLLHAEADPLSDEAKVWARERLEKLRHAPAAV